jgi:hypothetical protein
VNGVELCGGIYMIVGDHGNCDDMVQRDVEGTPQLDACGKPLPKPCHSLNEVRSSFLFILLCYLF